MNAYATHHHYYFLTFTLNYKREKKKTTLRKHGLTQETKGKKFCFSFSLNRSSVSYPGQGNAGFHYNNVVLFLWGVLKPI